MKSLYSFGKYLLTGHFAALAGAASLISLFIYFTPQSWAVITALCTFILFLIGIFIRLIYILNGYLLKKTNDGYLKLATYVHYTTLDGNHIHYELHKYIQCKQLIMEAHLHDYKWTGTRDGKIASTQQHYIKSIPALDNSDTYQAVLKFKKPLIYNETALVEFIMDMDDSDHKSMKFCGQTVKENIHLISFNIELKHLSTCNDARMIRRRLNSEIVVNDFVFAYITFDTNSKSFHYNLFDPEPNYHYRLDWSNSY